MTIKQLEPYACGAIKRLHGCEDILLASQPTPADFEQAKQLGVKSVINQRPIAEMDGFDEQACVTGLGMDYANPAFNGTDELTDAKINETIELLRTAQRPILMHCASANRTGAIWFAYRAIDGGLTVEDALAEGKTVGLRSGAYEQIVRDYIARHK